MIFVSVESPLRPPAHLSGDARRLAFQFNIEFARQCLADSIRRGECPTASHLLFPQVLDDDEPRERERGLLLGRAWLSLCDLVALYTDHGISEGMKGAEVLAQQLGIRVEHRRLYEA